MRSMERLEGLMGLCFGLSERMNGRHPSLFPEAGRGPRLHELVYDEDARWVELGHLKSASRIS